MVWSIFITQLFVTGWSTCGQMAHKKGVLFLEKMFQGRFFLLWLFLYFTCFFMLFFLFQNGYFCYWNLLIIFILFIGSSFLFLYFHYFSFAFHLYSLAHVQKQPKISRKLSLKWRSSLWVFKCIFLCLNAFDYSILVLNSCFRVLPIPISHPKKNTKEYTYLTKLNTEY
jgi:hypothetical protein